MEAVRHFILSLCLVSSSAFGNSNNESINYFAKDDQWSDVQISPGGETLSAITYQKGKKVIALIDSKSLQAIQTIRFYGQAEPGQYHWVNSQRLVAKKHYVSSYSEVPYTYNEFYGFNADGSNSRYVFGVHSGKRSRGRYLWGEMLSPMIDNEDYMLMIGTPMSHVFDIKPTVYRINVRNGKHYQAFRSPLRRPHFLMDKQHQARFVTGFDDEHNIATLLYKDKKWINTKDLRISNDSFIPVALNGDADKVYALYHENGGPEGLYRFDLITGQKETLFQSDFSSINHIATDSEGQIYAASIDEGTPATVIIDSENNNGRILKKLMRQLNGYNVRIVSETLDGSTKVVLAQNQYNPGDYMIYDTDKAKLSYLFSKRGWVDSNRSANVMPIRFKTRDGLELLGYITLPKGIDSLVDAKKLPLLVNVHGGPHGQRDQLVYDSENQFYADNGIAVLQVNYRGSTGFGDKFYQKGFGHWGDKIQYDIIDAVNFAVKSGYADSARICIMGDNFGGYSALQSSILEPDLFKCSIGVSGMYDLNLHKSIGRAADNKIDSELLDIYLGSDENHLKTISPTYNVAKLKSPTLIIHSGKNKRVPIQHAEDLIAQLKSKNKPYQYIELEKEDNHIHSSESRAKVFTTTLSFLKQHLKLQ